jgi:hypothetical protein
VWDDREPWPADREPRTSHTPRIVIVIVFAAVMIGSTLACCAAVGQLLELIGLDAPGFL